MPTSCHPGQTRLEVWLLDAVHEKLIDHCRDNLVEVGGGRADRPKKKRDAFAGDVAAEIIFAT